MSAPEQHTGHIEVAGRKILELHGGDGAPLLYLHSTAGEAVWLPYLQGLAQDYAVYAPAHPGWHGSEGGAEMQDIADLVDHYLAYLDGKGWDAVPMVGLSLGGWIAAEIAVRHPERVSKLMLMGSVGLQLDAHPIADIFAVDARHPDRFRELMFLHQDSPIAQLMAPPASLLPEAALDQIEATLAVAAQFAREPLFHNPKLESQLQHVSAPTLCLWGAHDRLVPPAHGERYAERIPGARFEALPDCGHMVPLEQPEAFLVAVKSFVG